MEYASDPSTDLSFLEEEIFEKPTLMLRAHSNSSSSTQESITAEVSPAGSPYTENVAEESISYLDDDQKEFFDFCSSLEYVPIPDFQYFEDLKDENKETMLNQSKKIRKEKVQKSASNKKSSIIKENWKPEEDALLVTLYAEFGPKWSQIAACMGTRNGKQIRDRYTNMLRPGISHADWTPEEVQSLFSLCEQFGNKWCKIASHLPGRTEYQVKNKFYWEKRKEAAQAEKPAKASKKSQKSSKAKAQASSETISKPTQQIKSDKAIDNFFGNGPNTPFVFSDSFKEVQWPTFN